MKLHLEQMESKETPLSISLDFRFDNLGLFTHEKQIALQNIADEFAERFETKPIAINQDFVAYTQFGTSVDFAGLPEDKMIVFIGIDLNPNNLASASITGAYTSTYPLERNWGGSIGFNPNINWSYSGLPSPAQHDIETIFKHEMGHVFGLSSHSMNYQDLMYSSVSAGKIKDITINDAKNLQNLGLELKSIPANFDLLKTPFPGFGGGFQTSSADFNGDKITDFVFGAGQGGGPHVKIINGANGAETESFYAFESTFSGGVNITVGDYTNDGKPDLVVGAGKGGGPRLQVYSQGKDLVFDQFVFSETQRTGVIPTFIDNKLVVNDGNNFKVI